MNTPDIFYVVLIATGLLLDHFVLWPGFQRRSKTDPSPARWWVWTAWMAMLWTLTTIGIVVWLHGPRHLASLGLVLPHGWRLAGSVVVVTVPTVIYVRAAIKVARIPPSRRIAMKAQFGKLAPMLPHSRRELAGFVALSVSAGICEEFLFRGFLIRAFQPVIGLWAAAILSIVAFALAHAYQGAKGILATGIVGALLTVVVLVSGSLLPAIVLHALADIGQGTVAWLVLRRMGDAETSPPPREQPDVA